MVLFSMFRKTRANQSLLAGTNIDDVYAKEYRQNHKHIPFNYITRYNLRVEI